MKKELLNESEIRKMMKFANLQPLTTPFINKLEEGSMAYQKDDEDDDLDMVDDPSMGPAGDAPSEPAGAPGMDLDMGPEAEDDAEAPPSPDMDMGDEAAGEEVTWSLSAEQAKIIAPVMDDLAAQVREMAGDEEGEEADLEDMPAEEPEAELEDEPPTMAEEADPLEEEDLYISEGEGNDLKKVDVVNEVARRVAQRLIKARRAKKRNK